MLPLAGLSAVQWEPPPWTQLPYASMAVSPDKMNGHHRGDFPVLRHIPGAPRAGPAAAWAAGASNCCSSAAHVPRLS